MTLLRSTVRGCYGVHPRRTDPAQSAGHDGTDGPDKPCKFRIRVLTFWSFAEGRTVPTHRQRPSNGLKQGTFWRRADRRRSPRVDRHRERRAEQLGTISSSSSAKTRRAGYQRGRAGSWHKNYDFVRLARKRYALTCACAASHNHMSLSSPIASPDSLVSPAVPPDRSRSSFDDICLNKLAAACASR